MKITSLTPKQVGPLKWLKLSKLKLRRAGQAHMEMMSEKNAPNKQQVLLTSSKLFANYTSYHKNKKNAI